MYFKNYNKNHGKHINFFQIKKNTINSLNEVECFLNKSTKIIKCLKLYKLLK